MTPDHIVDLGVKLGVSGLSLFLYIDIWGWEHFNLSDD